MEVSRRQMSDKAAHELNGHARRTDAGEADQHYARIALLLNGPAVVGTAASS